MKNEKPKKLTDKLKQVLQLLTEDYDIPQMTEKLGVAYRALEGRMRRLKLMFDVRTTHGLLAAALRSGQFVLDSPKM